MLKLWNVHFYSEHFDDVVETCQIGLLYIDSLIVAGEVY